MQDSANMGDCIFESLPRKIRARIFGHLAGPPQGFRVHIRQIGTRQRILGRPIEPIFKGNASYHDDGEWTLVRDKKPSELAAMYSLMLTSKLLYFEIENYLYSYPVFVFDFIQDAHAWIKRLGPFRRMAVHTIHISVPRPFTTAEFSFKPGKNQNWTKDSDLDMLKTELVKLPGLRHCAFVPDASSFEDASPAFLRMIIAEERSKIQDMQDSVRNTLAGSQIPVFQYFIPLELEQKLEEYGKEPGRCDSPDSDDSFCLL